MRSFFSSLYRAWMKFAHVLGWINGRILLTIMFVIVIGPYAIVRKLMGRKKGDESTYWIVKKQEPVTLETMKRIF